MPVVIVQADARALPLPDSSVDAVVCDPPYGLSFMGKKWDKPAMLGQNTEHARVPRKDRRHTDDAWRAYGPGTHSRGYADNDPRAFQAWCQEWAQEALRVLKPGGHAVCFGGTRTYHRLVCGLEDAGFEIRDEIRHFGGQVGPAPSAWVQGSGFPKSLNVTKALADQVCQCHTLERGPQAGGAWPLCPGCGKPVVPAGLGSALKPAHEPIVLARKPFRGSLAANVLAYGTGALNVDQCRVSATDKAKFPAGVVSDSEQVYGNGEGRYAARRRVGRPRPGGRFPPNTLLSHVGPSGGSPGCVPTGTRQIRSSESGVQRELTSRGYKGGGIGQRRSADHDPIERPKPAYAGPDGLETVPAWQCEQGCPVAELDRQSGTLKSGDLKPYRNRSEAEHTQVHIAERNVERKGDQGGASRFYPQFAYDPDLDDLTPFRYVPKASTRERNAGLPEGIRNPHSTVKPVALMRWLVRLVTPPGGRILDMFAGSGTTGVAAALEGIDAILTDLDQDPDHPGEYLPTARARVRNITDRPPWIIRPRLARPRPRRRRAPADLAGAQLTLLEDAG